MLLYISKRLLSYTNGLMIQDYAEDVFTISASATACLWGQEMRNVLD